MDEGDKFLIVILVIAALLVAADVFRNSLGTWYSQNGVWIIVSAFIAVLLIISFYFRFWRPIRREVEEEKSEEKEELERKE